MKALVKRVEPLVLEVLAMVILPKLTKEITKRLAKVK